MSYLYADVVGLSANGSF